MVCTGSVPKASFKDLRNRLMETVRIFVPGSKSIFQISFNRIDEGMTFCS